MCGIGWTYDLIFPPIVLIPFIELLAVSLLSYSKSYISVSVSGFYSVPGLLAFTCANTFLG